MGIKGVLTKVQRQKVKNDIQELMLKGYNSARVVDILNIQREREGLRPLTLQSIYGYLRELKQESNAWYLELLKDQTAYVILHRRKLLELDLYKKMINDKITLLGGISGINPNVLNRMMLTLLAITKTQSDLEKEIPKIFNITAGVKSHEEIIDIEHSIVSGLTGELRQEYEKKMLQEKQKIEREYIEDPTHGNVNLAEFKEDTYVI